MLTTVSLVLPRQIAEMAEADTRLFKKGLVSMRVQGKRPRAKGMGEVGWGEG